MAFNSLLRYFPGTCRRGILRASCSRYETHFFVEHNTVLFRPPVFSGILSRTQGAHAYSSGQMPVSAGIRGTRSEPSKSHRLQSTRTRSMRTPRRSFFHFIWWVTVALHLFFRVLLYSARKASSTTGTGHVAWSKLYRTGQGRKVQCLGGAHLFGLSKANGQPRFTLEQHQLFTLWHL